VSDLVERLRANVGRITPYSLDLEAADEIERLRKLIDGAAETGEIYERKLSRCEAENDALLQRVAEAEATLRKIADHAIESPSQAAYWARSYFAPDSATHRENEHA